MRSADVRDVSTREAFLSVIYSIIAVIDLFGGRGLRYEYHVTLAAARSR